jgi:hypothetical protein
VSAPLKTWPVNGTPGDAHERRARMWTSTATPGQQRNH